MPFLFFFTVKVGTPTDEELEFSSREIGASWKKLGRRLGMNGSKRGRVHNDHIEKMLLRWEQRDGSAAIYRQDLYDGFTGKMVNRQDLDENVCLAAKDPSIQTVVSNHV